MACSLTAATRVVLREATLEDGLGVGATGLGGALAAALGDGLAGGGGGGGGFALGRGVGTGARVGRDGGDGLAVAVADF